MEETVLVAFENDRLLPMLQIWNHKIENLTTVEARSLTLDFQAPRRRVFTGFSSTGKASILKQLQIPLHDR